MKKILFLAIISFISCRGYNSTIIERQQSLREVCPNCTLSYATLESINNFYIAQDTSKQPNVIYQVIFCDGVFQPVWKVKYLTKIN